MKGRNKMTKLNFDGHIMGEYFFLSEQHSVSFEV